MTELPPEIRIVDVAPAGAAKQPSNLAATRGAELKSRTKQELRDLLREDLKRYSVEVRQLRRDYEEICTRRKDRTCIHSEHDPKTGQTIYPKGAFDPCPNRACMIEQIETWIGKISRWVENDKWAGSESKPDDVAIETVPMTQETYSEQILRTESTMGLRLKGLHAEIDKLRAEVKTLSYRAKRTLSTIGDFIVRHQIAIIIVVIVILILITVVSIVVGVEHYQSLQRHEGGAAQKMTVPTTAHNATT